MLSLVQTGRLTPGAASQENLETLSSCRRGVHCGSGASALQLPGALKPKNLFSGSSTGIDEVQGGGVPGGRQAHQPFLSSGV